MIASNVPKVVIKNGQFGEFLKTEACGQTVLPDRSLLIGQTLVENVKIQMRHFKYFSNIMLLKFFEKYSL